MFHSSPHRNGNGVVGPRALLRYACSAALLALAFMVAPILQAQEGAPDPTFLPSGSSFIRPDFAGINGHDYAGKLAVDKFDGVHVVGWGKALNGSFDAFYTLRNASATDDGCNQGFSLEVCFTHSWGPPEASALDQVFQSIALKEGQFGVTDLFIVGTQEDIEIAGSSISSGFLMRHAGGNGSFPEFIVHGPSSETVESWFNDIVRDESTGNLIVGGCYSDGPNYTDRDFYVYRFLETGVPDASFGNNGELVIPFFPDASECAKSVALAPDGSIILGGGTTDGITTDFAIVKVDPQGTITKKLIAFDQVGGGKSDKLADIVIDQAGRIVALGTIGGTTPGDSDVGLVRLLPDLTVDTSFGPNGSGKTILHFDAASAADEAGGLSIAPDSRLWIVGTHPTGLSGNQTQLAVAKLAPNGVPQTFEPGQLSSVRFDKGVSSTGIDKGVDIVAGDQRITVLGEFQTKQANGVQNNDVDLLAIQADSIAADVFTTIAAVNSVALSSTPVSLEIGVGNAGSAIATDVVAKIVLPLGASIESFDAPGWTCADGLEAVDAEPPHAVGTCTLSAIGVGGRGYVNVLITAPAAQGAHSFEVMVAATEHDAYLANNKAFKTIFVQGLQATKAVDAGDDGIAAPGEILQYGITVTGVASGAPTMIPVVVTDAIPDETTYVPGSAVGPSASYDPVANEVSWTIPSGATSDPPPMIFSVTVSDAPAGSQISNTHHVNGAPGCAAPPCVVTPLLKADLAFSMSAPARVGVGTQITYQIDGENQGPAVAHDVSITLPLPAGTTFLQAHGSGWACAPTAAAITCLRPFLAAGYAAPTLAITLKAPTTNGTITAVCDVSALELDTSPADSACEATTQVTSVTATKAVDAGSDGLAAPGEILTYSILVSGGQGTTAAAASKVVPDVPGTFHIYDPIPAGTTYVPGSAQGPGATYVAASKHLVWTLPDSFAGVQLLSFKVQVSSPLVASPIENTHLLYESPACNSAVCVSTQTTIPALDTDGDGEFDDTDNCPLVPNAEQTDTNADDEGDACDTDDDGDQVLDVDDNCPLIENPDQKDSDKDTWGDACDPNPGTGGGNEGADTDSDTVLDSSDNCVNIPNIGQGNSDSDEFGDACDDDDDNDNVDDADDNCQFISNQGQENADEDAAGDACDDNQNQADADSDSDGVVDPQDNCPLIANADQENNDGDHEGDVCEDDDDNDGVPDADDNCQFTANPWQEDTDGNGVGDVCETGPCAAAGGDVDNDGICGNADVCPATAATQCVNLVVDVLEGASYATDGENVLFDLTLRNIGNLPANASSVSLAISGSMTDAQWSCEACPQTKTGEGGDPIAVGSLPADSAPIAVSVVGRADGAQGMEVVTLQATAVSSAPLDGNPNDNLDVDSDPLQPVGIFSDGFENP